MGGGSSRSVITNAFNDIVARSYLNVTTQCQLTVDISQIAEYACEPYSGPSPLTSIYEANPNCVECFTTAVEEQQGQYELALRNNVTSFSYNQDLLNFQHKLSQCLRHCKACIFADFSQTNNFRWDTNCNISVDDVNTFRNEVQSQLTQALTDKQDVLSSLAGALGASDKQAAIANIMNRVSTQLDFNFMQSLKNNLNSNQALTLRAEGGGVIDRHFTQAAAVNGVSQLVSQTGIDNRILSEAEFKIFQQLYNEENTLGELGNILAKSSLGIAQILSSLIGKITIILVIIITIVVVIIAGILIARAVKHQKELRNVQ